MYRFLLLLTLVACSGGDASADKSSHDTAPSDADTDTDADTDADADADTDTDTDTHGEADLSTYDAFIDAHSSTYCGSLSICGFLGTQGYADTASCGTAVAALYRAAACDSYQTNVAALCVRDDFAMRSDCAAAHDGEQPLPCRDVCTAAAP